MASPVVAAVAEVFPVEAAAAVAVVASLVAAVVAGEGSNRKEGGNRKE